MPRSPNILLTAEGRAKIADAGALECAIHSFLRACTGICIVQLTPTQNNAALQFDNKGRASFSAGP